MFKKLTLILLITGSVVSAQDYKARCNEFNPDNSMNNSFKGISIIDLVFLTTKRIPVGSLTKRYKTILKKLKRLKLKLLKNDESIIIATLSVKDKVTRKEINVMNVCFIFENKKVVGNPPYIQMFDNIKLDFDGSKVSVIQVNK